MCRLIASAKNPLIERSMSGDVFGVSIAWIDIIAGHEFFSDAAGR
jgi:hypothetical protein